MPGSMLRNPAHHPQYFHAHGTGTPAGDPQEAEAISAAFFGGDKVQDQDQLYVGSIKTVIGYVRSYFRCVIFLVLIATPN